MPDPTLPEQPHVRSVDVFAMRTPHRRWPYHRWDDPATDKAHEPDAIVIENREVGRLLGPNGETLRVVREHPSVEFGFRP